ncbi:hypothetical protein ALC62_09446, partial [Cyphomyrmex costatus]
TVEILGNSNEQTVAQEVVIVQEIPTEDVNNINQKRSKNRKTPTKRLKTRNTSPISPSCKRTTRSSLKIHNLNVSDITVIEPILEKRTRSVPRGIPRSVSHSLPPILPSTKENGKQKFYLAPEYKSIELFFDGMAQAVKKLPSNAQTDIKLSICKLVTEAEIEYCSPTTIQSTQVLNTA